MMWSIVFVVVAVVVVGAAMVLTQSSGGATSTGTPLAPGVVTPSNIPSSDRTLGDANATVTVDLYGDFRCTACFDFTTGGTEQSLVTTYVATGKAKLVWHDFLTIDGNDGTTASRDAANAAWCAADQGKFWTMHDWLYANQSPTEAASAFTLARLAAIGKAAGLDMTKFQPCLDNGTHDSDIAAEQSSIPSDAGGTPALYVNGKLVGSSGSVATFAELQTAIDAALGLASPSPGASGSAAASGTAASSSPGASPSASPSVKPS
jgi:protein-disulfide isomerase